MVVDTFRYYAGAPERLTGKTIPVPGGVDMTFHEPLGVVALITPWNFPLLDRLVEGGPGARRRQHRSCSSRPRSRPLTSLALGEIARRGGRAARGRAHVVAGPGSVCGQRLVEHPDVAKVAFTGSTEVRAPHPAGVAGNITRVSLELGGKSANIVFADADLEPLRRGDARSRVRQRRAGLLRPHRASSWSARRYDALRGAPRGAVDARSRWATPLDESTDDGPADLRGPAPDVARRTRATHDGGDRVAAAGAGRSRATTSRRRSVVPDVANDDRLAREEIFGPVACVIPFRDEAEAIRHRQRQRSTASSGRSGPATPRAVIRVARALDTGVDLGQLEHRSVRVAPRSAASSSRGSAVSSGWTRWSTTPS